MSTITLTVTLTLDGEAYAEAYGLPDEEVLADARTYARGFAKEWLQDACNRVANGLAVDTVTIQ